MGELGLVRPGNVVSGPQNPDGGSRQEIPDWEWNCSCTLDVEHCSHIKVFYLIMSGGVGSSCKPAPLVLYYSM